MPNSFVHVSPDPTTGTGGGDGPEGSSVFTAVTSRNHGLLTMAFGFALGVATVALYILIGLLKSQTLIVLKLSNDGTLNLGAVMIAFGFGFVLGTVVAATYNFLVVQRLNLFGIESRLD